MIGTGAAKILLYKRRTAEIRNRAQDQRNTEVRRQASAVWNAATTRKGRVNDDRNYVEKPTQSTGRIQMRSFLSSTRHERRGCPTPHPPVMEEVQGMPPAHRVPTGRSLQSWISVFQV